MSATLSANAQFEEVRPMLVRLASNCVTKMGGEWEEAFAEATLLYCKALKTYNPEKGAALKSWIYFTVSTELISWRRREHRHCGPKAELKPEHAVDSRSAEFVRRCAMLSAEAAMVLGVMLDPPSALREQVDARLQKNQTWARAIREVVRDYAISAGVCATPRRFQETCDEIRELYVA
jgi:DNA-directed RNA polymerase specialized sigma24 family protein